MDDLIESLQTVLVLSCVLLGVFAFLYRRSIAGLSDPLFLNGLLVSFYLAGLLTFLSRQPSVSTTTMIVTLGITAGLFGPALWPRGVSIQRATISAPIPIVRFFQLFAAALLLANLIVNYAFGVIPLLTGTESRSEQGGVPVPTLVLIAPNIGLASICVLALVHSKRAVVLGRTCALLWAATVLLSGAKSAILQLILVLVFFEYLRRYKSATPATPVSSRRRRQAMLLTGLVGLAFAPVYFFFVASANGTEQLWTLFLYRLFTGFDIVVHMVVNDIDITRNAGASAWQFYLFPFLKLLGATPDYQSAGQYVSAEVFGYGESLQSLNPNSNLLVEWILTLGNVPGAIVALALVLVSFRIRARLLSSKQLRLFEVFLLPQFVFAPFGILLDGSLFFLTLLWTSIAYLLANTLANVAVATSNAKHSYRLY